VRDGDEEVPPAIPAATVVLVRDGVAGPETLMLRRDPALAFAGGAWVFPGGRIDPPDYPGGETSGDPALVQEAARRAAAREANEEAGLTVDPTTLVWFAHWTPGRRLAHRFATWFFIAHAPSGAVVVDDYEIREHRWLRPVDAMAAHAAGEIELIVPTWMTLHMLATSPSADAACATARTREPEIYVTHITEVEGGTASVWQGDVAYDDLDLAKPGPRNRLLMLETGWQLERT
jgi:8-oxo-dGTP pyrophosphatase MutT (NUDIX family)